MFHHWTENVYFERFPKEISWIRSQKNSSFHVFFLWTEFRGFFKNLQNLNLFEWLSWEAATWFIHHIKEEKKVWCALRLEFEKIKKPPNLAGVSPGKMGMFYLIS